MAATLRWSFAPQTANPAADLKPQRMHEMAPPKPAVALLLAFVVLLAAAQPSAAIRVKPACAPVLIPSPPPPVASPPPPPTLVIVNPTPTPSVPASPPPPTPVITNPTPSVPASPPPPTPVISNPPPSIPASPPPAPVSPATPPLTPSQPTECLTPLMGLTPCMGYLTNTSVATPPAACCGAFKSLAENAPICLCHGLNGDINKIMPAPMDLMRMMSLPGSCGVPLPLQTLAQCATAPVPPLNPPTVPSTKPSV